MQKKRIMWNIPRLEFWLDVINIGVAISLAASFIFGVASIVLSRQLGKIKDEQSAAEKAGSDERIASANAEAAKANAGIGESNERIAPLNTEAEELRAEAEKAKAERAEADKLIATAKADAATASQRTAETALRVEEEARKRAEAERALLVIQERFSVRTLTAEQRENFVRILKEGIKPKSGMLLYGIPPQVFVQPANTSEAILFAGEISLLIAQAWHGGASNTPSSTPLMLESPSASHRKDVTLHTVSRGELIEKDARAIEALLKALRSIGLSPKHTHVKSEYVGPELERVNLFIGARP